MKLALTILISFVLAYLWIAFIAWQVNPAGWSAATRSVAVSIGAALTVAALAAGRR